MQHVLPCLLQSSCLAHRVPSDECYAGLGLTAVVAVCLLCAGLGVDLGRVWHGRNVGLCSVQVAGIASHEP